MQLRRVGGDGGHGREGSWSPWVRLVSGGVVSGWSLEWEGLQLTGVPPAATGVE